MIKIKNKHALSIMAQGGELLAQVVAQVPALLKEGMTTVELDAILEKAMRQVGLVPVCKGYGTYRHATCISVNDVVVHGVPSEKVVLKNGDLVKLDIVGGYKGYCVDMARSFFVGTPKPEAVQLVQVAQQALDAALDHVYPGKHLSDISACIQNVVEQAGYGVVRQFAGHGIGVNLHEDPEIPNFGTPGEGPKLRVGMVLAIEPMITQGGYEVKILKDGWTAVTCDGSLAAHVEDTVAVTENGPVIFTRIGNGKES